MSTDNLSGVPYRPPGGQFGPHGEKPPSVEGLPPGTVPAGYEVGPLPGGPGIGASRTPPGTPFPPAEQGGTPAGFPIRVVAFLGDLMLAKALAGVLGTVAAAGQAIAEHGLNPRLWQGAAHDAAMSAGNMLPLTVFAYLCFFTVYGGRTPGKMAFSLYVVRSDGGPMGPGRALLRSVSYLASFFTWGIGFLMAAGNSRKALHDRLSGTRVMRRETPLTRQATRQATRHSG